MSDVNDNIQVLSEQIMDFVDALEEEKMSDAKILYYLKKAINVAGIEIDEDGDLYFV